jgi:hypothetical protein
MKIHGHTGKKFNGRASLTYRTWDSMIRRCYNKNHKQYVNYGARGIRVCSRWLKFEKFLEDMGEKPSGKSIDRINTNSSYCIDNCRWATTFQQRRNSRGQNNKSSKFRGVSYHNGPRSWGVAIRSNGTRYWLGRYKSETEAARAYDKKAKKLWGDDAYQNLRGQE